MARKIISSIEKFVAGFESKPFFIGVDVHKRTYSFAIRREDGEIYTFSTTSGVEKAVLKVKNLGIAVGCLAYEAGPTGFSLARAFEAEGIRVIVAAPSKIPRPVTVGSKNDRLDCIRLAEYAARGLLKPISVPTCREEGLRSLVRRRKKVVNSISCTKNRIKSHLLCLGVEEPQGLDRWTKSSLESLSALEMDGYAHMTLSSFLRELGFLTEELKEIEDMLKIALKGSDNRKKVESMRTVPGVGPTVSAAFALEIYRPKRFKTPGELASYLGLAPTVRHSGERTPSGRLVPSGQGTLRSLLIEAAWIWKTHDTKAAEIYNKLVHKTGVAQKAITAVARRLAIILWRLCIEERPYREA